MSRHRKGDLPSRRPCTHPGCTVMIWRGNHTYDVGLCKHHGGARVGKAAVREFVPPEPKPERQDVRSVEVVKQSYSGSGSENGFVRVSLAREPWL